MTTYDKAQEAADFIRSKFDSEIVTAIVLGSGLGAFADEVEGAVSIPYEQIPNFARSTVVGHAGRLVLGKLGGSVIAVQQGRFHYYEGYEMDEVTLPVRTFGLLGVNNLILTNAAGSLNTDMRPGNLMLISDHINMMGVNPLCGANDDRFGPRFPDMTEIYTHKLQRTAVAASDAMRDETDGPDILQRGVYCALSGPTYETPSEIHLYRLLGADAVGMSTVPEAIAARHQGMNVLGISCITNFAAGMNDEPINHNEVMETGARAAETFKKLLIRIIAAIAADEQA